MIYHHSSGKRPGNSTYELFKIILYSKVECKLDFLDKMAFLKYQSNELNHTIRKCKKMAGQNTFQILLLNDANMRTL
jgi:hypothetical protein